MFLKKLALPLMFLLSMVAVGQEVVEDSVIEEPPCSQKMKARDALIDEAEQNTFYVRRIEIQGADRFRYREYRKRWSDEFVEGALFTRTLFENNIQRMTKFTKIYPITIENTELRLDRKTRDIDIVFCVKEKPRK